MLYYPKNIIQLLSYSGAIASHTGDTLESTFVSVTIPGGTMGVSSILRITAFFSYTNSANNKTLAIKFGGTTFASITATTTNSNIKVLPICNRNSLTSQVSTDLNLTNSYTGSTGTNTTAAINTAADQTLAITGTLASSGETVNLEAYFVELIN